MNYLKTCLTLAMLFGSSLLLNATIIECECGTHEVGITAFSVEGTGCCDGKPTPVGVFHLYQLNQGVWEHISATTINGQDAQDDCCDPT